MTFAFFIEESVKFFKNLRLADNWFTVIVSGSGSWRGGMKCR